MWSIGWWRVGIVFSVLWLLILAGYAPYEYEHVNHSSNSLFVEVVTQENQTPLSELRNDSVLRHFVDIVPIEGRIKPLALLLAATGPIVFLWACLWMALWIRQGFNVDHSSRQRSRVAKDEQADSSRGDNDEQLRSRSHVSVALKRSRWPAGIGAALGISGVFGAKSTATFVAKIVLSGIVGGILAAVFAGIAFLTVWVYLVAREGSSSSRVKNSNQTRS